jgi:hypothetical protein
MSGTWYTPGGAPRDPNESSPGDDSYLGTAGSDFSLNPETGEALPFVAGGEGNDVLDLGEGDDWGLGNDGDDIINGGGGNDLLQGAAGNDALYGDAGDDYLNAQPGDDTMHGGAGSDTAFFRGAPDEYRFIPLEGGGWRAEHVNPQDAFFADGTDVIGGDVEWFEFGYNNNGDLAQILPAPCFAAGTRIMTARGEVPVEALRAGDMVVTLGLQGPHLRPVRWIGHRAVDCRRHPRPDLVVPVRILAGALGPGVPARDLVVSPDHALHVEGMLVPAVALVDGHGVRRDRGVGKVAYFHVELDAHDVLLAEGTPAESWLDCGHRAQFDNGGLVVALHPDFAADPTVRGCAPRLAEGPALDRLRLRLAARRPAGEPALRRA